MDFKFIHAADVHLDSPLRGLERYEGAPVDALRNATREAFERLVTLTIDEEAAFLILAGDLYDGDWRDYNTGLFLVKQMVRLRSAGVRVFVVHGNHDARSQITRSLDLPDNVHVFDTRKVDTQHVEKLAVALHGQSYRDRAVDINLAARYPPAEPGLLNIGVLHTSVDGREGHDPYAPCTLSDLLDKGYDYWALGHVHTREVLSQAPWILFSGNLQGRHVREPGPKGATLVSVGDGQIVSVAHCSIDVLRWHHCRVDVTGVASTGDVLERVETAVRTATNEASGHRLHAVRIELFGPCAAHRTLAMEPERWIAQVRAAVMDRCGSDVWVEKVRIRTQVERSLAAALAGDHPLAELLRSVEGVGESAEETSEALDEIRGDLQGLQKRINHELGQLDERIELIRLEDRQLLARLLDDAKALLIPRLVAAGGGSGEQSES